LKAKGGPAVKFGCHDHLGDLPFVHDQYPASLIHRDGETGREPIPDDRQLFVLVNPGLVVFEPSLVWKCSHVWFPLKMKISAVDYV
jgi:hypothetical protein